MEKWEASIQDYEVLVRETPGDEEVGRALFEAKVQLKKQRGEDVKDMKLGSGGVVAVSSIEHFRDTVTSPGSYIENCMFDKSQCLKWDICLDLNN